MKLVAFPAFMILVLLAVASSTSFACEGCSNFESISSGSDPKMVGMAYSWTILLLLAVPFGFLSMMIGWIAKHGRTRPLPPA